MSGTDTRHVQGRGINYRALDDLFAIRESRRDEVHMCAMPVNCCLHGFAGFMRVLMPEGYESKSTHVHMHMHTPSMCLAFAIRRRRRLGPQCPHACMSVSGTPSCTDLRTAIALKQKKHTQQQLGVEIPAAAFFFTPTP